LIVVDSSAWIEFFAGNRQAKPYFDQIASGTALTPTIVVYEVYKVLNRSSATAAAAAARTMRKMRIVPLTTRLAILAAEVSGATRLAMADAIVYATAFVNAAELVTFDADFQRLPGVTYIKKERA
jgi:predicted nucleic acid-binding protein